jgi:phage tail-like protein
MSTPTLAPVRRPPHDPTSLLLDGRVGWSIAGADAVASNRGELTIARDPSTLRELTEQSGSFGGLRPPSNVAVTPDGEVWLLDNSTGWLLHFDACGCAFVPVRCFAPGSGSIAVAGGRLFLTDPAAGWLKVLVLPTTALSERWAPPMPWQPSDVVVDRYRQVLVADPRNGMLHTFSWTGRYLGNISGLGASSHVAVDRDGVAYLSGELAAYRVEDGIVTPLTASAQEFADRFAPLPFDVDPDGNLGLGVLCVPPTNGSFDLSGRPLTPAGAAKAAAAAAAKPYLPNGTVTLGPLDSLIDGCTWHRVVLHGSVPAGCSVEVSTFTAHAELAQPEIDGLAESAWRTRCTALSADDWDCLITSAPARYLWLRLRLTGTGRLTPSLASTEVEFPRISLRSYLPAVFGAEPESAEFTDRFLALFDRSLRDVEDLVDGLPAVLDPQATPYLEWLESWVGLAVDPRLPERTRRLLLAMSGRIYDLRGTLAGLRELLLIILGIAERAPCTTCEREPGSCQPARSCCPPRPPMTSTWTAPRLVLEHFRLRRWLQLGAGHLGDEAVVWGRRIVNRSQLGNGAQVGGTQLKASQDPLRDPFHVYAHRYTVFVPAAAGTSPQQRRILQRLLDFATPVHTVGSIEYVEPRFRIGIQSCLGLDSVVARVPAGLVLGETPLGQGTMLTGEPGAPSGPPQLGTTTVLS